MGHVSETVIGVAVRLTVVAMSLAFLPGCLVVVPLPGGSTRAVPVNVASGPAAPMNSIGFAMNDVRAAQGLAPLAASAPLMQAAEAHAQYLARTASISHTGSDGRSLDARVRGAGCRHFGAAENLAWGMRSDDQAVSGWASSAGHRSNILGNYTNYGSGTADGYYVAIFSRGC